KNLLKHNQARSGRGGPRHIGPDTRAIVHREGYVVGFDVHSSEVYNSRDIVGSSNPSTISRPLTRLGRLMRLGVSEMSLRAAARGGGLSFLPRSRYSSFLGLRNCR